MKRYQRGRNFLIGTFSLITNSNGLLLSSSRKRRGKWQRLDGLKRQSQEWTQRITAVLLSFRLAFLTQVRLSLSLCAGWPLEMKKALIGELLTVAGGFCSTSFSLFQSLSGPLLLYLYVSRADGAISH